MKTIEISLSFKNHKSLFTCLRKLYSRFGCHLSMCKFETRFILSDLMYKAQVNEIKEIVKSLKTKPSRFLITTRTTEIHREEVKK